MTQPLVVVDAIDDGAIWRVRFGDSRGNVLDIATLNELTGVFRDAAHASSLKAICVEGAGADFSFGASIQEHLPDRVAAMLQSVCDMMFALLASHTVVVAAVRGRCLGGGLELASLCHRVFATSQAQLGQPEIALGVFAPVASLVLPGRVGRAHAEDLCLTGRVVSAREAHAMGLIDEVVETGEIVGTVEVDVVAAATTWCRERLGNRSASSLRLAVQAVRSSFEATMHREWPAIERLYLDELMHTPDANEGLRAFLQKRAPRWQSELGPRPFKNP